MPSGHKKEINEKRHYIIRITYTKCTPSESFICRLQGNDHVYLFRKSLMRATCVIPVRISSLYSTPRSVQVPNYNIFSSKWATLWRRSGESVEYRDGRIALLPVPDRIIGAQCCSPICKFAVNFKANTL